MNLQSLLVVNRLAPAEFHEKTGGFLVETCQRSLLISAHQFDSPDEGLVGTTAYEFLLRVAAGLESRVVGEADIFGQIKSAWKAYELVGSPQVETLRPWIQYLFEDVKEVRREFLQNVGSASYGSLVRKLIRQKQGEARSGKVLLIGTGQIAEAIAPWLTEYEVLVWNRTESKLFDFKKKVGDPYRLNLRFMSEGLLRGAFAEVDHVLVCIPSDVDRENDWSKGWRKNPYPGALIHLGGMREQLSHWQKEIGFFALDDLFDLQKNQNESQRRMILAAEEACRERAILRSLGGSMTLPHGWEDLGAFA